MTYPCPLANDFATIMKRPSSFQTAGNVPSSRKTKKRAMMPSKASGSHRGRRMRASYPFAFSFPIFQARLSVFIFLWELLKGYGVLFGEFAIFSQFVRLLSKRRYSREFAGFCGVWPLCLCHYASGKSGLGEDH